MRKDVEVFLQYLHRPVSGMEHIGYKKKFISKQLWVLSKCKEADKGTLKIG